MSFFSFDIKKVAFIVFILAMPLLSINTQQGPQQTNWFSKPFSLAAEITEGTFFSFSTGVRNTTSEYLNLLNIKKDNQSLRDQNSELQTRLSQMEELMLENHRLAELLDFKQKTKMELIGAKIMSRDLLSDHNTIRINKGSHHGVKSGQAVITTKGVVGYVFRPESFSSQVLLITDRYAVVDGVIQKSRARGIVEGQGKSACALTYVERSESVEVGDLVVTSGLDNIFPKGLPVATVSGVEHKNYSIALKIDLIPVVDPNKIEEVFIVTNAKDVDLSPPEIIAAELANAQPTASPTPVKEVKQ